MQNFETEDQVRDYAKICLGFDKFENKIQQGTGQITTFNQLGFKGEKQNHKPDGWYLPDDPSKVAIILEVKSDKIDIMKESPKAELFKNMDIISTKYNKVIGILYNGDTVRVFKNKEEVENTPQTLQKKDYYISLFTKNTIDKNHIYELTQNINNILHFKFGMTDLEDRMIFTACALVVQRFNPVNGLTTQKGQDYDIVHGYVSNKLALEINTSNQQSLNPNRKLNILLEEYNKVQVSIKNNIEALNTFIDNVCEISELINSDYWNGEDVMAIFFNEFNRYRGKSQAGQVFTPEHIVSFIYRLIDICMEDRVLDATCGSGTFLVKAMSNMIKEAGGVNTEKANEIKSNQLFGIELYRKIFALSCANMLIHKDGKTNLEQLDAQSVEAAEWIRSKNITKVTMNTPYERRYGCMKIVKNVLDNVPSGTKCAFILPDKKLEKDNGKKLLKNHTLTHIIKLPEALFFGIGVTTSIFVFETGKPQNGKNIKGYYIEDDGLETVKNKGRQDVKGKWPEIEDYWIKAIQDDNDYKYHTRQLINPKDHLSYQIPKKPFEIYEEDFVKTMMDYEMYKKGINVKEFNEKLLKNVLYDSKVEDNDETVDIKLRKGGEKDEN